MRLFYRESSRRCAGGFSLVSTLRLCTTSKYISKDFNCFFRLRSHSVSPITIYRLHQKYPGKRAGQNLTSTQPLLCMYLCMYLDTQNKKTIPPSRLRPDGRKNVCTYTHKCDFSLSLSLSLSNRGFCDINSSPIYSCRLFWRGTIPLCIPAPTGMSEFQDEYERIFNNGVIPPDMSICWLMSQLNISDIVRKIEQTYYSPHLRDYFHYTPRSSAI